MSKKWIVLTLGTLALTVFAEPVKMPSKSEINAAKDAVEALMSSGTTAEEFLEMASESESSAERYHAYRCAFILQAKGGKFAEAAETLKTFQAEVTGVPALEIVSLIDKNVGKKLNEAKELQAVYNDSKSKVTAEKQIAKIKKEIKENPKDSVLQRSLAEATAISGDWTAALKEFEKVGGVVADIVKVEKKGATSKIAAFWWDYKPHKNFGATNAFKLHAASLYAGLLSKGGLSKFEESLAEKRVAAAEELGAVVEEPAGSDGKPKSELAALKKICNTKGLVHCWRFNGNLKDCIGKSNAQISGEKAKLNDGQLHLWGDLSYAALGEQLIASDTSAFTIELWATQHSVKRWSRMFSFGDCHELGAWLNWTYGSDLNRTECSMRWGEPGGSAQGCSGNLAPFSIGEEYHFAVVFARSKDEWVVTAYKQGAQTGQTMGKAETRVPESSWSVKKMTHRKLDLACAWSGDEYADASYNEVRIWNRALSEEELTQNAIKFHKAGETMKNLPNVAAMPTTPARKSSSFKSTKSSTSSASDSFGTILK